MVKIRAFKGLLYDSEKVQGDLARLMAPPYDVISPSMREDLYKTSDYNIIRLILGKDTEADTAEDNKYIRAKKFLSEWMEKGILTQDEEEALYIYSQEYEVDGKTYKRTGFFALMKIDEDDEKTVLPHEHTLSKPKEDRLNLIKHVNSNLSPIFSLYEDDNGQIKDALNKVMNEADPVIDVEIDTETHRLWRVTNKQDKEIITNNMDKKRVFIADGHHRYEVARTYRNFKRDSGEYNGEADYILMYFADMLDEENLTVLATHRAIKNMPLLEEETIEKLKDYFEVTPCDNLNEVMDLLKQNEKNQAAFGFYGGTKFVFLKPKNVEKLIELITEDRDLEWKKLDVSILHSAVLDKILKVEKTEGNITYVKKPEEGESLVKDGTHKAAFFLNPTQVKQLRDVAELGEMMPQKSTYFYPKLLTGLVINKLQD